MVSLQSPGIQVNEIDTTTIVPSLDASVAAIGGVFSWGPIEDAELVSTEKELVARFGTPTNDNFETFLISSNFLAYSDALYVSRAADANAFNASVGTGNVANIQIKNLTHFTTIESTGLSANAHFYARYAGSMGNGLKVAVCGSLDAYSSIIPSTAEYGVALQFAVNSNVAILTITDATANTALAANTANNILSTLQVGDYVRASSNTVGSQLMKITAIGTTSTSNGVATTEVGLETRFSLSTAVTTNGVSRFWEYYNLIDKAPGTSAYTSARGGNGDEMHVVVVDTTGVFTGTPNTVLESFVGLSRATDATGEQGGSIYFKDVLNRSSSYIYAKGDLPGLTSGIASVIEPVSVSPYAGVMTKGTNSLSESTIPLNALARAYDVYKNPDDVDVSIFIAGKSVHGVHGEGIANYIIDNIVSIRKDAVIAISPTLEDVVNNPYGEAEAIIQLRRALRSTSYAELSTLYKYQYDRYNNKYRWVAGCGDIAGLLARTDRDRDPWYSHAGEERGTIKNIVRLAYNPDQADRDLLYKNDINSVINKRGAGVILYGDKTLHGKPSAFDRMNVRRLFIQLQKSIKIAANSLLFEFNDEFTRARFRNIVEPYLRNIQGRRGIQAYKVICDETNNTGFVIDSNQFIGDIYIKPARSINFIYLNFVAVGTEVAFEEAVITQ